jgi:uncharacterized BrkB/YihY/UPF0761 family membrane protein
MIYGLASYGLISVFLIWVLYRFFVKKDLKKHQDELFGGLVFIGVWIVILFLSTH